jgi:hypothetical protein
MIVYWVCSECACAIEYCDYISSDLDVERVESFIDRVGMLADAGWVVLSDWDCDSCGQAQTSGVAKAFESVG